MVSLLLSNNLYILQEKKNILVSGSHRSGTTWTGKILATDNSVDYIDEPFNLNHNKIIDTPLVYWYEYVSENDSPERIKAFESYLDRNLKFRLKNYINDLQKAKSIKQAAKFSYIYYKKISKPRKLIKDPIALMSAEWLVKRYNLDVLLLVRHPAAFVASLKVKDWKFDYFNFANQPLLVSEKLQKYKSQIDFFVENPNQDIVKQGILLWNIIYDVVLDYQHKYPNWYVVTHEKLSNNPIQEYEKIFKHFNLEFSEKVKKSILLSSEIDSSNNSKLKRDSKSNITSWKARLSAQEIELIKEGTKEISEKYYTNEDW